MHHHDALQQQQKKKHSQQIQQKVEVLWTKKWWKIIDINMEINYTFVKINEVINVFLS